MLKKYLTDRNLIILAFLCAVVILFINLGGGGLPAAQEGRTAIIVRNMLRTGDMMSMKVPYYSVEYEKPVGHYWMCLPTAALFGVGSEEPAEALSEWGVRLPSALSALAVLAAAALLAFRIYGARTCALTVFMLSTTAGFVHLARLAHIDMPLAATIAWSMYFLYTGYFEKMQSNAWIYGFYIMLGLGMMLKGPLVIPLAGMVGVCMMLLTRRWKILLEIRPAAGLLIFLAITLPWYIAENIHSNGAFFEEFIMNQNIRRFTGQSTYRDGEFMAIYYYVPKMFLMMLPWSVFSILGFLLNLKKIATLKLKRPSMYLFFWFSTGFIFFSLSALKRGDYVLMLYVPLAIMTSAFLVKTGFRLPALTKKWLWVWGILSGTALLFAGIGCSGLLRTLAEKGLRNEGFHISKSDGRNLIAIGNLLEANPAAAVAAGLAVILLLFAFGKLMEKAKWQEAFSLMCGIIFLTFTVFYGWIDAASADRMRTVKPFAAEARKIIPPGESYVHCHDFNTELLFMMNRPYTTTVTPETRYLIIGDSGLKHYKTAGEKPEWKILLRTPPEHMYGQILLERVR